MTLEYLWSPWRMEYIENNKNEEACVFCIVLQMEDGIQNLVIHRDRYNYVILNRYPYTSGHLMIVPFDHKPSIEEIETPARAEMMELCVSAIRIITKEYHPQGFNIGINIGQAAGAGILEHTHLHIVPRWKGDTNFLSTLGEIRVLPEALEETYERIKKAWQDEHL